LFVCELGGVSGGEALLCRVIPCDGVVFGGVGVVYVCGVYILVVLIVVGRLCRLVIPTSPGHTALETGSVELIVVGTKATVLAKPHHA